MNLHGEWWTPTDQVLKLTGIFVPSMSETQSVVGDLATRGPVDWVPAFWGLSEEYRDGT